MGMMGHKQTSSRADDKNTELKFLKHTQGQATLLIKPFHFGGSLVFVSVPNRAWVDGRPR